ncbi:Potassium channel subfamily K member 13 [Hypsibius exemplaris]|uniref:Potassium channel subfamily K member 13 n=1 Tax=Hypsibius exemplaris TaxID=2072580 RepID=A0A1W0XB19_HYPEX|nr:Potassium channel subfamily K member 13 [Hypsibius exemplaris]
MRKSGGLEVARHHHGHGHHRHGHTYGWCDRVCYLSEDNARFLLLVFILAVYLTVGTAIFYFLEVDQDKKKRLDYEWFWGNFSTKYRDVIEESDLNALIEASSLSYLPFQSRPKVDLYQSFYLAFTACATIGFGHMVPQTTSARAVMIIYGLFGCSAAILFYNLFLERIITLLALVLRTVHEYKRRKRNLLEITTNSTSQNGTRRNSILSNSSSDSLENWKPSVYWVMVCLFCLVSVIALTASALFAKMEAWDYFTALYFSFVCFATVGFGDVVTAIKDDYGPGDPAYRLANVLIIIVGTSSLYSLFNVVSIIIKHGLNFTIKKMDQQCCKICCRHVNRAHKTLTSYRRNAISLPGSTSATLVTATTREGNNNVNSTRMMLGSAERSYSEEENQIIDVREFLANKVSLAVMQKDLHDSANQRGRTTVSAPSWHHSRHYNNHRNSQTKAEDDFTPTANIDSLNSIGPLAIVQHTLRDDD